MEFSSLKYKGSYSRFPDCFLRVETSSETLFELKLFVKDGYFYITPFSTKPELYKHVDDTRFKFIPTGGFVDLLDPLYGASKHFIGPESRFFLDFANLALEITFGPKDIIQLRVMPEQKSLPPAEVGNLLSQVNPWKNDVLGYLLHGCMSEHEILPVSGEILYILFPRVGQQAPVSSFVAYVEHSLKLGIRQFDKDENILVAVARDQEKLPDNLEESYAYIQEMFMLH